MPLFLVGIWACVRGVWIHTNVDKNKNRNKDKNKTVKMRKSRNESALFVARFL